ncbi:MAG: DUF3500 domain-containing protein [Solirubrobacterales bacterium]
MSNAVYGGYGPRPRPPGGSLVRGVAESIPMIALAAFSDLDRGLREPFFGLTTDGRLREGLFSLSTDEVKTAPMVQAARRYLELLPADRRPRASLPFDHLERRRWTNAFPAWEPGGLRLEDLAEDARAAAMDLVAATLSAKGFADVRKVMRLNGVLGEIIGDDYDGTLREWIYWLTIFGEPDREAPWGWQIMGHHLDLNCFFLGDQMVITPMFMGTEINHYEGADGERIDAFQAESETALELIGSLSRTQQDKAVLHRSMLSKDLPPALIHPTEGRHHGGAGQDNLILPYEGIGADALTPGQREGLLDLVDVYIGRAAEGHRAARMAEIKRHLDETHFAWIGSPDGDTPFYYKVHNPVVLIEFDHHSGVFLDNDEPERFHVHSIVRTPNAGDYGMDLLRMHYERFHSHDEEQGHSHHGHTHSHPHSHPHTQED